MGHRHRKKLAVTELKLQNSFKLKAVGKEETGRMLHLVETFKSLLRKKDRKRAEEWKNRETPIKPLKYISKPRCVALSVCISEDVTQPLIFHALAEMPLFCGGRESTGRG